MSQFDGDIIIIEFGLDIVEGANILIENVKKLRADIKSEHHQEIPLIRIKDNNELQENEYKIIIKGITVKQALLKKDSINEKVYVILEALKEALIPNIQSIVS